MEFEDKLKEKIDSKEKWEAVQLEYGLGRPPNLPICGIMVRSTWWVQREQTRLHHSIYETTETLDRLNEQYPHLCVHISKDDRTMVSYTPDTQSGEADRQLRLSLGKLLKRVYPWAPDEAIQRHCAEHLGDISNDIEWVTGEAIATAYDAGVGSCMSNKTWDASSGIPPTHFYDAPNIKLAVLRDSTNPAKVTARCLVYEASENDKRMIRLYGDQKLHRRLQRAGYRYGSWIGATFRKIELAPNKYLAPYLDGDNSSGSMERSAVAMIDGEIRCITREVYHQLHAINPTCVSVLTNTNGFVVLDNQDSKDFQVVTQDTQETVNLLTDMGSVHKVYINPTETAWFRERPLCRELITYDPNTSVAQRVYALESVSYFTHRYNQTLDTDFNRKHCGYRKLSQLYYPGAQEWVTTVKGMTVETVDGHTIRSSDAIHIIRRVPANGGGYVFPTVFYHKSQLDKSWVKVHSSIKTQSVYTDQPEIVSVTTTNRKVIVGYHDLQQLWDGSYTFTRNTSSQYVFGKTYYWETKGRKPDLSYKSDLMQKAVAARLKEIGEYNDEYDHNFTVKCMAMLGQTGAYFRLSYENRNFHFSDWLRRWLRPEDQTLAYHRLKPEQVMELMLKTEYKDNDFRAIEYHYTMAMAEANAVEGPERLTDAEPVQPLGSVGVDVLNIGESNDTVTVTANGEPIPTYSMVYFNHTSTGTSNSF